MDANPKASINEVHQHIVDNVHRIVRVLIDSRSFESGTADELMLYAV